MIQNSPDELKLEPVLGNSPRHVSFDLEEDHSSEVEYIQRLQTWLGRGYPALLKLIKCCLLDSSTNRLSAEDALGQLQRIRQEVEGVVGGCDIRRLDLDKVQMARELRRARLRIRELEVTKLFQCEVGSEIYGDLENEVM